MLVPAADAELGDDEVGSPDQPRSKKAKVIDAIRMPGEHGIKEHANGL